MGHATSTEYQFERQIDLVTLKDTSGVEGRFFLGTGRTASKFYYSYYYETNSGGVRFGRIDADDTVVYEENRDDAIIRVYGKDNVRAFGIEFADDKYEISVPRGTILRGYSQLDLE